MYRKGYLKSLELVNRVHAQNLLQYMNVHDYLLGLSNCLIILMKCHDVFSLKCASHIHINVFGRNRGEIHIIYIITSTININNIIREKNANLADPVL